jgi:hypothetical protein
VFPTTRTSSSKYAPRPKQPNAREMRDEKVIRKSRDETRKERVRVEFVAEKRVEESAE